MTAVVDKPVYEPVVLGPTWTRGDDGKFILPEHTLGWDVLGWTAQWLQLDSLTPWRYTPEQARFVLWWYAINEEGRFVYRDGIFQRLKGHGKDPLAATLSLVELLGPCRFSHWDDEGNPVVRPHPAPWIQIAAVSQSQTKNTFTLFPQFLTKRAIQHYSVQLGKEIVYSDNGRGRIEAVTSSPRAIEGARPSLVVAGETHHWNSSNEGHEMAGVISRNASKSADGAARTLAITNAYEPSEDSVAQRTREAYEDAEAIGYAHGILYDSLEAPPEAPLTPEAIPAVVNAIRGDSTWLDIDRITAEVMDKRNPPSRSRRFWFNQIVASEDAWVDPRMWDLCLAGDDIPPLAAKDEIALFLDCAKSDDTTALVGARLRDGLVATLGMWQRPPGKRGDGWTVPRGAVDHVVSEMFATYKVAAFFADPSHALDDESGERYWDGMIDDWHRRFSRILTLWAESGTRGHSILWDMTSPARLGQFTAAAERTAQEIEEQHLSHDGDGRMRIHVRNARRYPNRYGVSLGKNHRESARKIDLAVAMVGARLARRMVLNTPNTKRIRSGRIW
jgi:hypothetical protein